MSRSKNNPLHIEDDFIISYKRGDSMPIPAQET
jgi:hypothetical protein